MDKQFFKDHWHGVLIWGSALVIIILSTLTDVFMPEQGRLIPEIVWFIGAVLIILGLTYLLIYAVKISQGIKQNNEALIAIADALEKNRSELKQIDQNTMLSEVAKSIASRDVDTQALRDAVYEKLHQQKFDTTYEIIDEIEKHPQYKLLAVQLRDQAQKYQNATDQERENQIISHIEKLLDAHEWTKAGKQIEKLIWAYPNSERAKSMRQKLVDMKNERKAILLKAWDDAIKRQDTDRSLEILKELDLYLTPNEASALQEAAKDVFRNKLHNLGVQFSLAVSEKNWQVAFDTGKEIVENFPNSRMAKEIRARMDALKERAREQKQTA